MSSEKELHETRDKSSDAPNLSKAEDSEKQLELIHHTDKSDDTSSATELSKLLPAEEATPKPERTLLKAVEPVNIEDEVDSFIVNSLDLESELVLDEIEKVKALDQNTENNPPSLSPLENAAEPQLDTQLSFNDFLKIHASDSVETKKISSPKVSKTVKRPISSAKKSTTLPVKNGLKAHQPKLHPRRLMNSMPLQRI